MCHAVHSVCDFTQKHNRYAVKQGRTQNHKQQGIENREFFIYFFQITYRDSSSHLDIEYLE